MDLQELATHASGSKPQQFQLLSQVSLPLWGGPVCRRNLPDGSERGRKQGEPQQFQQLSQIDVSMKSIKSCFYCLPACLLQV